MPICGYYSVLGGTLDEFDIHRPLITDLTLRQYLHDPNVTKFLSKLDHSVN